MLVRFLETTGYTLTVAILTDPGGPVLDVGAERLGRHQGGVAILTDPGGPVLDCFAD